MDVVVKKSEVSGRATPPPSKSYTHRAFFAAALSKKTVIENPLYSGDTISTLKACDFIGAEIEASKKTIKFIGVEKIECQGYINVENSGTTLRILLGLLAQSPHESVADGDESLRKRPNKTLALALKEMGAKVESSNELYTAPIRIRGRINGKDITIKAESSQFVSSLLYTMPLCEKDSTLRVKEVKSKPYIDLTLHVLSESGIKIEVEGEVFYVPGGQKYNLKKFLIPADFSSASYLIAAGVLAGKVIVENVKESKQGDKKIIDIVKDMGGKIKWIKDKGEVIAEKSELEGIEVDCKDIPDLVPTISVLAAVAKGKTVIKNAEHLRIKEIDRIEGCYSNLKALGVEVEKRKDGLAIKGKEKIEGGVVDSYGDHRMALAFSLLGLISERGVTVRRAEVVSVSFPRYFDVLKSVSANIEIKY